jgi:hypothetical protein
MISLTAEWTRSHCRDAAIESPVDVPVPHYPIRVIVRPHLDAGTSPATLKLRFFLALHIFTSRVLARAQTTAGSKP